MQESALCRRLLTAAGVLATCIPPSLGHRGHHQAGVQWWHSVPPNPAHTACIAGRGFLLVCFAAFFRSGLCATLLGPQQLREVDMFTSKELLLIKHQ